MGKRIRLTLDDDVAAKLEEELRKGGGGRFSELINEVLRVSLHIRRDPSASKPFKVRARPLGNYPDLAYDNVGDLLEQLEGPTHH